MNESLRDKLHRYRIALFIGLSVWILQTLVYVAWADSKALLGDALHNAADNIVLLGVIMLTSKELAFKGQRHSHADRSFTKSAIILLWVSALFVAWEGVGRIIAPVAFPGWIVVATASIAGVGSFFAHRSISGVHERVQDHKHEASVLHVLGDLVISIIVAISALLTILLGTPAIDGVGAILAALWMLIRGAILWREIGHGHHHHH